LIINCVAFREVHNALRQEVNRLQEENNDLEGQVDRLERQTKLVKELEQGLDGILREQNTTIDTFVHSVKENAKIQMELQDLLMWDVLQNVMTTVFRADVDNDFQIDPEEVNMLLLRIKQIPGVESVQDDEIRRLLALHGNGLDAVVNFIRSLKNQPQGKVSGDPSRSRSVPLVAVSPRNLELST
jgi:hypothetical protein